MIILQLDQIHRSFDPGRSVLNGVDLEVEPGEVVGLLGVNGAGKTTLLRIAMGMLHPHRGSVRLFGLDPFAHPVEVKRRVGFVAEDQSLPPYLRVRDVLEIQRELYPSWDRDLERDLVGRFSMNTRTKIARLSKGEARRVAVIGALAHRPELLLLDEPASGFDPAARREFLETALRVLSDEGSAVVFSSHQMQDVERIAGRVVLVHEGFKRVDRPLDELREEHCLAVYAAGNGVHMGDLRAVEGCLAARQVEGELHATFSGEPSEVRVRLAADLGHEPLACRCVPLEELFIEMVGGL